MLVLLIFISIGQDVLWLYVNRDVDDDDDDGGVERSVKKFSRTMSYISLGWRVSTRFAYCLICLALVPSCHRSLERFT